MSVVLLGYRGCGKTTLGKKLADRMWIKFVDTDDLIVSAAGKTIREIFETDGEKKFRDLEVEAVRDACGREDHVVALGGGAVLRDENRTLLKSLVFSRLYLRCEPGELLNRIQSDPATAANRPSLTGLGGPLQEIESLLKMREPLYRDVMTAELDVTNLNLDEALKYVARMI
ncbi:MAG: shikimate kinase [Anaerolineae bacterium]|nr:shikimate kinase [Phycisphaerae bacterium]